MPRPLPAAAGQRWRAAPPPSRAAVLLPGRRRPASPSCPPPGRSGLRTAQQLRPDADLGRRAPPWSCLAADGQHRQVAPPPGRSGLRTTQQAGGRTPTIPKQ